MLCRKRPLRRADHSLTAVLPTVCLFVCQLHLLQTSNLATTTESCTLKITHHCKSEAYEENMCLFVCFFVCLFPSNSITITKLRLNKFCDDLLLYIQQLNFLDFHKLKFLSSKHSNRYKVTICLIANKINFKFLCCEGARNKIANLHAVQKSNYFLINTALPSNDQHYVHAVIPPQRLLLPSPLMHTQIPKLLAQGTQAVLSTFKCY